MRSRTSFVVTLVGVTLVLPAAPALAGPAPAGRYDAAVSSPREDPYYPAKGDPSVDALHYGLDLAWDPGSRTLQGTATIRFRVPTAESRLRLDLGDPLRVRWVRLDGRAAHYQHPGKDLVVDAGRTLATNSRHTLVVRYYGHPRSVPAPTTRRDVPGVGWTTTRDGRAWTMQEPFGAFTWYPVNDQPSDKAFYDARISVPSKWVGVFNGRLTSRKRVGSRTVTRWHLASPAASYLTTIAIGDYVRLTDRGPHDLPITYWVPRGTPRGLVSELRRTPTMLRWLESHLGRYPFDRAGAVVVPSGSAMETQTLVTMGGRLFDRYDPYLFRADLLHEYVHQWYGDTVTPDNWKDLWLNESFAMYTQIRWEATHGGASMAEWRRYLEENDQSLRDEDGPPGAYDRTRFAETCVYYCGALMLDRLRSTLGETAFNDVWRAWPQQHRQVSANRSTYVAWINARTGRDLTPFLDAWLDSSVSPVGS